MSPNFLIALRFLTANKRAMLLSLSTLVFGVGFFIVTQAQTTGFQEFFIKTVLGTNGAIQILDKIQDTQRSMSAGGKESVSTFEMSHKEGVKYLEGVPEPKQIIESLKYFRNVSGYSTVVKGAVLVRSSFKLSGDNAQVYGIILDDHLSVSDMREQIVRGYGTLEDFRTTPNGILMGRELASRLEVSVGDTVTLEYNNQLRRYRISALYQTGVSDIDRVRIFMQMGEARSLFNKPTGASFIQVKLFNRDRAREDAARIEDSLQYSARSWQERERAWLSVFRFLQVLSLLTVLIFILISGLSMYSNLAMIVMEKTKEIAILRSMGYTRGDIAKIFLWLGALVLIFGTVAGWIVGASVTYGLSKFPMPVRGIFTTDTIQVTWSKWHYIQASITSTVVVMLACLIPSRRAALLEPGDVVRGTSQ